MNGEHNYLNRSRNILVTSIGNKVPMLKTIKTAAIRAGIKDALLWGGDMQAECIGQYFVDEFWKMPPLVELNGEALEKFCVENHIGYIIPSRDGELLFFARYKKRLAALGIEIMVSNDEPIEICLDKLLFYNHLQTIDFPVIPTCDESQIKTIEGEGNTYVVKERYGAGSRLLGINLSREEARRHGKLLADPVFQPFIAGKEYSVDFYVQRNGKAKGAIVRSRDYVVNGESQITMSKKMPELEQMCLDLAKQLGITGHALVQAIVDEEEKIHIVECNCRFGGASTLSVAMGLDSFYWFFMESQGNDLEQIPFVRSAGEKKQVRYAENLIL